MSLNGLDDVKVKAAFELAAIEPGGWFLLRYAARDEVDVLERGTGGIVEIRNSIAKYEDPSPLFGFLRYRRRNILIKYVPDTSSRLVQARVAVHFTSITEKFNPHDFVFPITTATELRDTELSAACSLHTASGSTSSSTDSLRRRRLIEIAEDEEEEKRISKEGLHKDSPLTAEAPSLSGRELSPSPPKREVLGNIPPSGSFLSTNALSSLETAPPPPREPRKIAIPETTTEPRTSSQSTRPDLYSYTSYGSNGKPKVKLAPRPSLDVNKRPHTSTAASFYRPVSTLPQGVKMLSKGPKEDKIRPLSQYDSESSRAAFKPPPIPEGESIIYPTTSRPHTSGGRPSTSSGASLRSPIYKNSTMTPEKARLLKAMELRKKKNAIHQPEIKKLLSKESLKNSETPVEQLSLGAPQEVHDTLTMLDHIANGADSAIALDATSPMKTDDSDATRSDLSPISPLGASEGAESTQASSIAESADETTQEGAVKTSHIAADTPKAEKLDGRKQPSAEEVQEETPHVSLATSPPSHTAADDLVAQDNFEVPVGNEVNQASTAIMQGVDQHLADDVSSSDEDGGAAADLSDTVSELETPSCDAFIDPRGSISGTHGLATCPPQLSSKVNSEPNIIETRQSANDWRVPTSKFSSQSLPVKEPPRSKFSTKQPSSRDQLATAEEILSTPSNRSSFTAAQSSAERSSSRDTRLSSNDQENNGPLLNTIKRRGIVEPIKTDFGGDDHHTAESMNFSSDDEFMDELQSAVVQEAKPISLPKTPLSPVHPNMSPEKKEERRFSRAASMPLQAEESVSKLLAPSATISNTENTRAVSAGAAYLTRVGSQASSKPIAKKANLGSGISQRIMALEKLSSTDAIVGEATRPSSSSTAFFSVRKSGPRPTSSSQSVRNRADSITRSTPSPGVSQESSPQSASKVRGRSGSIQSRVEALNSGPGQGGCSQRESISVTARIVRDPGQPFQPKADMSKHPSTSKPLYLKKSPLEIDHQKATKPIKTSRPEPVPERRPSSASKSSKERRSSITIVKDMIHEKRSSFAERRRSITIESSENLTSPRPPSTHASYKRGMSPSGRQDASGTISPPGYPASYSAPSLHSPISPNEDKDKKPNRASRMLRRMSSSLSSSRKSLAHAISPTLREDPEPPLIRSQPSPSSMAPMSIPSIGDVNVQFPDTLLWKRRCVLLDPHQGFLILSPALTATSSNRDKAALGATRKFHFGDFKGIPNMPDVEMQELPNSVVMELSDGSGLQIACEDRAGQKVLLHALQDAYRSSGAFPR